ncbi:hypothetical protein K493DRAFT_321121 [Basidiobolus meristosporus CBS 931.73]|uniref:Uncharacterized protein n=1 Tax=Basidiobolus meristosporus CBS 931.73 TaxID=1314790 RepID=A0A1Y1WZF5_9FUNG|nr:hypothetical protein K493DRAFT_321121 [Basidiobolus meristosporus CBS 931.73]|eukprot:ORX78941.1 hypothetical protein K493DRAFT_321121 [Basidiobolus meristosporus CBS 931.73]
MTKVQQSLFFALLGSACLAQGQVLETVTLSYPSETITWFVPTEMVTDYISAHTQIATIDAITYSETVSDATITENDGRSFVTRTIPGETFTRQIPSSVVEASLQLTSISRTLWSSYFTETFPSDVVATVVTSGIAGDLTTITGPTSNGIAIGTVIEQLSSRSVINTIPGPTVTHHIGQGEEIVLTDGGSTTTQFDSTSTFIETFGSTLVTRHIATSSLMRLITITPSSSGSVSGSSSAISITSAPTLTITQNATASTTVGSTVVQTSVVLTTLGPTPSNSGTKCPPKPRHTNSKKCSTKPSKCSNKPKPTKCHRKKSGKWAEGN